MVTVSGVLGNNLGISTTNTTSQYYHFPENTNAEALGMSSLDWPPGRFSNTHVTSEHFDNSIELDNFGLVTESGKYTSPVIDLGEVTTFKGSYWDEDPGIGIDGTTTRIEARWGTTSPVLDSGSLSWQAEEYPSYTDPLWGETGTLDWIELVNGILTTGINTRYIQWRVIFDVSEILTDETKLGALTTEDGINLILE